MRRVPGSRALALAARWFDAATVSRVFEPLIADYQREWLDATPARRPWISVRGMIAFARLWLRWGALNRRRGNWYSPLPASLATVIAFATFFALYLASVWVEPNLSLKPGTGLWLPIALLVMWGIAERWCSRHQVPTVGTPHPGTNP